MEGHGLGSDPAEVRTGAPRSAGAGGSRPHGSSGQPPETVDLHPKPPISRIGRSALAVAALAGMVLLMVLTLRYSRESLEGSQPGRPAVPGPPPTEVEQIERYRPPRRAAPPPSPAPEAARPPLKLPQLPREPSRGLRAALRAPLTTSRPPASRRGAERERGTGEAFGDLPSFEEFQRQVMGGAVRGAPAGGGDAWDPANPGLPIGSAGAALEGRARPRNLLPAPPAEAGALHLQRRAAASPYLLQAGTYLPAVLTHRVLSDQPGLLRAVLGRDVYDTLSGHHLLLPRGTVLLGSQGQVPSLGQERLAILWHHLQLPDGSTIDLAGTGAAPSAALDGSAGIPGQVRQHWGRRYGAAILLSLVGAGLQLSQPQGDGDRFDAGQIAAGSLGLELGRLSEQILRQYADLPPTIELAPGARLHVFLTRDLAFAAPYAPGAVHPPLSFR